MLSIALTLLEDDSGWSWDEVGKCLDIYLKTRWFDEGRCGEGVIGWRKCTEVEWRAIVREGTTRSFCFCDVVLS